MVIPFVFGSIILLLEICSAGNTCSSVQRCIFNDIHGSISCKTKNIDITQMVLIEID